MPKPKPRDLLLPPKSYAAVALWKKNPMQLVPVIQQVFFLAGFTSAKLSNPFPLRDISLDNQTKIGKMFGQIAITFSSAQTDLLAFIYISLDGDHTFTDFGFCQDENFSRRVAWIEVEAGKRIKFLKGTMYESMPQKEDYVKSLWHAFGCLSLKSKGGHSQQSLVNFISKFISDISKINNSFVKARLRWPGL